MKRVKEYSKILAAKKIAAKMSNSSIYELDGSFVELDRPKNGNITRIFHDANHIFFDYSKEIYRELRMKNGISAEKATWEFHN